MPLLINRCPICQSEKVAKEGNATFLLMGLLIGLITFIILFYQLSPIIKLLQGGEQNFTDSLFISFMLIIPFVMLQILSDKYNLQTYECAECGARWRA